MVKRIMAMFLAAVMLLSTKSTVLASELQNDNNVECIGQESVESVIEEYISAVDEQDYGKVVGLSHPGVREIMASVYSNEVNRENNVGLFNIRNIMLKNTMLSMEEALGLYYDHEYLSNFDSYEIALLSTEVEVNEEQDALINGEAYFCAIIVEDEGEIYESIEDIWPDYPSKEDFFFNEEEY